MPAKEIALDGIGIVKIYKRKGARSIRLSVVGDGSVRVTQPRWLPYRAGLEFATSRKSWIAKNIVPKNILVNRQNIGKSYQLFIVSDDIVNSPRVRVSQKQIIVKAPRNMSPDTELVQKAAVRGVEKALKAETEELLIPRLRMLSKEHGFSFRSVEVKKLKSRWGSCSQYKDIVLNSYLIQLPWDLIDYVLLHELQHTTVLAHGNKFWKELGNHVINLKEKRKTIKNFQARIN